MKNKVAFLCALVLMFGINKMKAQEKTEKLKEVVVVATKFEIEKEKVGKIIYKISSEDIKNNKGKSVTDLLNDIAGIHIAGNNSVAGKNKSVYIRGGREYQTLVLIDGVPLSDPSLISNSYDLRLLSLNQIESIEVLNGASSTLYGSGAATAVINIKLKEAKDKKLTLNYLTSFGTNNTQTESSIDLNEFNQNLSISGNLGKLNYTASLNTSYLDGMSEASQSKSDIDFEDDKFNSINSYLNIGYNFSKNIRFNIFGNFDKNDYDYDAGGFSDSKINNGEDKQSRFGFSSNIKYKKGSFKLITSFNNNNRSFHNYNSWTDLTDFYEYIGNSFFLEIVNNYKFSNYFQIISGVNYQDQNNETSTPYAEIDSNLAKYNVVDPYLSAVYNSNFGFNLNVGARLNVHSEYGSHLVYNINPSYNFSKKIRFISSYSTAFIAPSTYQLFSQYGNIDLKPESNTSIEAGFILSLLKKIELNTVFFYRETKDAIILPDFITYQNTDENSNAKGVEANLDVDILKNIKMKFGYAFTHKSSDKDYIPKDKITAQIESNAIKNTYLSLRYKNVSKRTYFDQWGTGEDIVLKSYSLFDLYGSYEIIKNRATVFLQINNILNADYEEVIGYSTKGRNIKIGLDLNF